MAHQKVQVRIQEALETWKATCLRIDWAESPPAPQIDTEGEVEGRTTVDSGPLPGSMRFPMSNTLLSGMKSNSTGVVAAEQPRGFAQLRSWK